MKTTTIISLTALLAAATVLSTTEAMPQQGAPRSSYGVPQGGRGRQDDPEGSYGEDYADAKYEFGWAVDAKDYDDNDVKYGHREQREGLYTTGEYYVLLPDTRLMKVTYYADATGFHPTYAFEGEAQYPEDDTQIEYNTEPRGYRS